jgi:hypothetical protein
VMVLTGGDTIRYLASHAFILYLILVVDGAALRSPLARGAVLLWVGAMGSLYAVYEVAKVGMGPPYVLVAGVALLLYVTAFLIRGWAAAGAESPGGSSAASELPLVTT